MTGLAPIDGLALLAIVAKAVGYAAALLAMGSVLFAVAFRGLAAPEVFRLARRLAAAAALVGLVVMAARFGIRAARISGMGWDGATDPMMLGVVWESPLGAAAIWRGLGEAAILAVLLPGAGLWIALGGALAVAVSYAQVGHTLGDPRALLAALLVLHLLAAAYWIGALAPLPRGVEQAAPRACARRRRAARLDPTAPIHRPRRCYGRAYPSRYGDDHQCDHAARKPLTPEPAMPIPRRTFLATGAAALAVPALPRRGAAQDMPILRAVPGTAQIAPEGYGATPVWTYGGTIPGPEIRVRAGERVRRRFVNDLPQPSAVHWHGIRIENAMDGAAGITQDPVPPGGTFNYDFVAPDPGTYWYHAHARSWEQVARGLAGPLIIEEAEPWAGLEGAATREATLMLADWRLQEDAALHEASFGDLHDWSHAGRLGNTVTINGAIDARLPVQRGERLRLRLINAATARVMPLRLPGLAPVLIALDGHPVAPRAAEEIVLAPAQRADVVVDVPLESKAPLPILMDAGRDEWIEIGALVDGGETPLPPQDGPVRALPMTMDHALGLTAPQEEVLRMEGGAMGGLRRARLGGVDRDFRELVAARRVWAFNGVAGDMDDPAFRAPLGRTVRMRLVNDTAWTHGIHLHGHHFEVLSRGGRPDPHRDRRDTVMVIPDEPVEIAFVADNPGRWLLHCHMLGHQASGMLTWFEVG